MASSFYIGFLASFVGCFFALSKVMIAIRLMINRNKGAAFIYALGTTLAQLVLAFIPALLTLYVKQHSSQLDQWGELIGGLFLIALSFFFILKKITQKKEIQPTEAKFFKTFLLGLFTSLLVPQRLFLYFAFLWGFGFHYDLHTWYLLVALLVGVGLASLLWWSLFCFVLGDYLRRFSERSLQIISRSGGTLLLIFGAYLIVSFCMSVF